jgi:ElaB/YqjD/DUF883 family membrane-anchored ribosome-binding protein
VNAKSMTDRAANVASDAAESVRDAAYQAADTADMVAVDMKRTMRSSMRDYPMATLALAVGLGFVIGALWKS